ncbi:Glyoxylate/hydroxypyruvate reductase A HPR2 [uncultured Alphaproteobacteria bacterium]|uniref:Glyoxylate/hydroxypyruvate reductase A HPR2 n=1 Tax=uncultured Alphaproteobacteria bacterium TaxID=91750 RepID=A0A212KM96_9PROT|nr:Glyoxylate/hydroxypyruvate reductase A HPR2 [uncultured Alphaproteobacteria bacterium]
MKPVILLLEPMMAEIEAALDAAYDVRRGGVADALALSGEAAATVRAIVTGGGTGAPPELVARLPQLGIVVVNGVGTDKIDLADARARGVRVTITSGTLADDVADQAIALLLAVSKKVVRNDRFVRSGGWLTGNVPLGRKVSGKRVGILGLGHIGREIARRCEGFAMEISYCTRTPVADAPYRHVADPVALARDVDILIVATVGGAGTRHLVNRAVLDALGPEGVLVNIARGSVVDEAELVAALVDGRLGGAGLDVFADEPRVPEALMVLDSVVLAPHQAGATLETRTAMGRNVLDNLAAFFAGREPPTPVV